MTEPVQIYKEYFFEAIIVGGGTAGLATAARLCEDMPGSIYTEEEHQRFHWLKQRGNKVNLINRNITAKKNFKLPSESHLYRQKKFMPQDLLVLDAVADRFMGQWDNQFASCQIPYLRSPMFFHPDPVNIDGMISFAHLNKREGPKDLMEIQNVVGREYSKHQMKKITAKNMKKNNPVPANISDTHDKPGIIDINMRDWKDYYRPSTVFFRDFCKDIVNRYNLEDSVRKDEVVSIEYLDINVVDTNETGKGFIIKTESGKTYGCKICIVASGHRGKINYPLKAIQPIPKPLEASCHTSHLFNREVEFPHQKLQAKLAKRQTPSVIVVGGGLTSAQIAHVCANKGIKVFFLTRGPLKVKHFDFHLDWVTKYRNVKKSAFYIKDTDEERWQMIQDAREGGSVNPEYHKKLMKHVKSGSVKLMRFSQLKSTHWNESNMTWDCEVETTNYEKNNEHDEKHFEMMNLSDIDYIYCATGITPDVCGLPFLKLICKNFPIDTVKGLPCLTNNLQWNDQIPLFMLGKNASLRTGPSSANLDGARLGAERIGWFIQDEKAKGTFDWSCCEHCISDIPDTNEDDLESKIEKDENGSDSDSSTDDDDDAFSTRLKLASGQMNWYSILQEA